MGDRLGIPSAGDIFCFISTGKNNVTIQKHMRQPGIEPGTTAWEAAMLTITPLTLL